MIEFLRLILHIMVSFFKPRTKLLAEILILRQQLNVLRRQVSKRPQLGNTDRFLFVWLYRWFPSVLSTIAILRPETIIRWHRAGFQSYWRERSRKPVGRPRISAELRNLIGAISRTNHLWGAPHIHGELLKLGFTIAQSTVARYMYRDWPPSQGWRTFLTKSRTSSAIMRRFYPTMRLPSWMRFSERPARQGETVSGGHDPIQNAQAQQQKSSPLLARASVGRELRQASSRLSAPGSPANRRCVVFPC